MNNNDFKPFLIYSAGVLPYSIDLNNDVHFLLGKDFDNKWSDFGGRCEANDQSNIINTAGREFWEESLGVIFDINYIKKILKKRRYVESKTYMGYPYYMFLVKIPHKTDYKQYFKTTRMFINNINNIDRKYKEKVDIRWFTLDAIDNHKGYFTIKNCFFKTFVDNKDNILNIIRTHQPN